ncbi:cell division cycle protein 123 homolog isoform X1 [Hydractinia symbiolongicarpus]|uniref:cell division cycle protein 123 homolog isoform X1 n=1 Tax=Hydractinia symbiolongicarpus TaxID=13093 RepID=UPI00254EC15A|nr:cell division cycle protein 123 homolog isoform X1 [Hydractinia symbiolongicarpus]
MKRQQCSNCMFSSWYHNFKNCTFKSKIIKLTSDFIDYLNSDGIILPVVEETRYSNTLEEYSDEDDWNSDDRDTDVIPSFPQLKLEVDNAIKELGGAVFPKLNWSSPKDAAWITHNGTLKCSSFNDICLLLKSSDFVTHDLTSAYDYCEDSTEPHPKDQFELVLREWCDVMPGMEFRCFVRQNKLVGISQRHYSQFFDYLVKNKNVYVEEIIDFYNSKLKCKFADLDYTFDVYKGKNNDYFLIDFNPFGLKTDSLLFSWKELHKTEISSVDQKNDSFFRIVTSSNGIQPSPYITYGMPKDVVDLSSGEDINKMIDFFRVKDLIAKPDDKEFEK